jgi:hypothetical protein
MFRDFRRYTGGGGILSSANIEVKNGMEYFRTVWIY